MGPPQGGHHRDMGRGREALRLPQGLAGAGWRPQVRPLRRHGPLPRPEMHVRAGDARHLPERLQEDGGAGQGCACTARPHREGLPGPRPDHEARGRHGPSQDHGRLQLPGRGHGPVHAHGRELEHAGQHGGRPRGRSPRMARSRGCVAGGAISRSGRGSQHAGAGPAPGRQRTA